MKFFLALFLFINSYAFADLQLKSNYFISHDYIMLSNIVANPKDDIKLYTIDPSRHIKRVRSRELLKVLHHYGYDGYSIHHSYVQFTQKSPINTAKIAFFVKKFFQKQYKNILFSAIEIHPRSYLYALPKHYSVKLPKSAYLKNRGTLYIKTEDNKKIFFNFFIQATLPVVVAKKQLNRGDELSHLNCKKKSIILDKFYAPPLQEVPLKSYEANRRIKVGRVLTQYDISKLELIKRGDRVNVVTQDRNIFISFEAKADQNGRLGDTIRVINMHGKRVQAVVIGRNRAEIR